MTEWQAVDLIRKIKGETADRYVDRHKAFDLAIRALKEIDRDREDGTAEQLGDKERKYVIVCNEHSGMWAGALLFWGHRTQEHEARSFGGYTSDIDSCELYSDRDLKEKSYHFPRYHEGMDWEEFRGYDDILIEPEYLERLGYKQMRVYYKP